jgi:hypothetical protein
LKLKIIDFSYKLTFITFRAEVKEISI